MNIFQSGFDWLISFFKTIYDVLIHIFESLSNALYIVRDIVLYVLDIISILPSWLSYFATITLAVCITYFIVGREHN